ASARLDLALPEICFGNNALRVQHDQSHLAIEWNTIDMLRAVKRGKGWDSQPGAGPVRVAYADEWARAQVASGSANNLTVQKPFDWTYTTLHPGSTTSPESGSGSDLAWRAAPPTHPGIPLASLARTDIPILFFEEVPLFEDELGDNGIANVTVRVRVNHESFFILSRFALRIDNVLFRHFDVRVYHAFGSGEILREVKGREAPYDLVRQRLRGGGGGGVTPGAPATGSARLRTSFGAPSPPCPAVAAAGANPLRTTSSGTMGSSSPSPFSLLRNGAASSSSGSSAGNIPPEPTEDLTPLTDPNWVAGVLEELALADELQHGLSVSAAGGTGQSEQGGAQRDPKVWEGKGRRLEVLEIPVEEATALTDP
ncbi:hypothetical protein JCM3774_003716, partial [Rhodotorula dairenensis]